MADQSEDGDLETRRNPINDLYRMADIKRWHIVRMDQKQSVAEHSFFVTLLSMRLASAIGAPVGRITQWALLHDAEEAWTGDIPSPLNTGNSLPLKDMLGDMYIGHISPITRHVVRICDIAESIKFIRRNGHSRHCDMIEEQSLKKLWDLVTNCYNEYPAFDWDKGLAELNFYLDNREETFIDDYIGKDA